MDDRQTQDPVLIVVQRGLGRDDEPTIRQEPTFDDDEQENDECAPESI